ncbi:MAG: hypothetical protein MUF71_13770 [Candidatus Kapabacteria bacterium]|jgi:hypothetical protein|nr:hypothetical protein [Candidatus Kapabacteria bacterium]
MSYTKNIVLDRAMQEEPHGIGAMPEIPFLPTLEELAQIEREQALHNALESIRTMKEFWKSGDRVKMAFVMKFCSDVQEWLNYLYYDSDFLSFGSDENFASPEPDWDNEVRRLDDAAWEVCNA